jgi:oxygen-independent coproporphyrinogen-3 oxidase
VQKAVNRVQSVEQVRMVTDAARSFGFNSISYDLIYGLPHQSVGSFTRTLREVIALQPDRLSVFSYAHLPARFKTQRQIDESALPPATEKLRIMAQTIEQLLAAGYVYIGMDHFARPDDPLALAQRDGTLYRNFQGYSTHRGTDLVGLGISSIGQVGDTYAQNVKSMPEYQQHIEAGRLPVDRGLALNADDLLRRDILMDIICFGQVDFAAIEKRHGICFERYFAAELPSLSPLATDGLVEIDSRRLRLTPRGRPLARVVCMRFDRYLQLDSPKPQFSRVI